MGAVIALRPDATAGRGGSESTPRSSDTLDVVVSVAPLIWPVKALAPDARVTLLAPAGAGCEGVDLTPSNVFALERADFVVLTGLGLEPQIEKLLGGSEKNGRTVVRIADVLSEAEREAREHDHAHDDDDDHEHHDHAPDQHLWLEPAIMERFVEQLTTRLARDGAAREQALATVRAIDDEYRKQLTPFAGRAIVTQHGAFDRLAERYGLKVAAVLQREHGAEPSPGDIARAAEAVRREKVRAVFVEPQLPSEAARRVAEITGARVLALDPLGDGDWPALMRRNLAALVDGLAGDAPPVRDQPQE